MTALVRIALRRPYTFVVLALLLMLIGPLAILRTPVDIFPEIRIPVVAAIWQYTGLAPEEMAGRMVTLYQRILTTTVNDIEHIEATSYNGLGIVKVFFQPGADIRTANAQVTAVSQTVLKQMPPNATPPLILNYNASTVPIIQLALSGNGLLRTAARRTSASIQSASALITVAGAADPLSLWRQIPRGSDRPRFSRDAGARPVRPGCRQRARRAKLDHAGRHREDRQLRIRHSTQQCAVGHRRIGRPADQDRQRRHGLHSRCGASARRQSAADQYRACRGQPLRPDAGVEERRGIDACDHRRRQEEGAGTEGHPAGQFQDRTARRSVDFHQRRDRRRHSRRRHRRGADQRDDPALSRQLCARPSSSPPRYRFR